MQATHFIEVWKGQTDFCNNGPVLPVGNLGEMLAYSEKWGINIVAIFKIKEKQLK